MLKYPQLDAPELLAEEVAFVDSDEPLPLVERVFALAGIDYGRIDFSFRPSDGALCVWEINTNPAHGSRVDAMPGRLVMLDRVTQRVIDGYLAEAEHASEARDRVVL